MPFALQIHHHKQTSKTIFFSSRHKEHKSGITSQPINSEMLRTHSKL